MFKEPKAMQEIHRIQEQLYQERRGLSNREVITRVHKEAEEVKKKYGLRLKRRAIAS